MEFARKSGVVINAAAGNYAVSGYWQAKPKADAPDTGTIDEPSIEDGVLAIGAFNNNINHETTIRLEIPALRIKRIPKRLGRFTRLSVDLPSRRSSNICFGTKGGEDTYRNAAVKDKIALVESGGDVTVDEDKVNALRQAGAKGSSFIKMRNKEILFKIFPWGIGDPSILSVYLVILSEKS